MDLINNGNQYLRLVDDLVGWLEDKGVPEYSGKFSRKDYTLHQHIVMLVLRSRERKTYRDFVEWLDVCYSIRLALGIDKAPHFTTLQKVAARLKPGLLERIMNFIGRLVVKDRCTAGIDTTGFSLDYSSRYYCKRIKRQDKHTNYLKVSLAGDMKTQVILGTRLRLKRRHDIVDMKSVLRKVRKHAGISIVVADRGYDSEEKFEFVKYELGARPVILLKNMDKPIDKTKGLLRRELKQDFPLETYHQRSKIETIISSVKQKYGGAIHSRKHRTKKNELYFKLIAYNCRRVMKLTEALIRGFLQG